METFTEVTFLQRKSPKRDLNNELNHAKTPKSAINSQRSQYEFLQNNLSAIHVHFIDNRLIYLYFTQGISGDTWMKQLRTQLKYPEQHLSECECVWRSAGQRPAALQILH